MWGVCGTATSSDPSWTFPGHILTGILGGSYPQGPGSTINSAQSTFPSSYQLLLLLNSKATPPPRPSGWNTSAEMMGVGVLNAHCLPLIQPSGKNIVSYAVCIFFSLLSVLAEEQSWTECGLPSSVFILVFKNRGS